MKLRRKAVLLTLLGFSLLPSAVRVFWLCGPGGDGAVAELERPDGTNYRVTQKWNDWSEPYVVSFYRRGSDGRWGWCYIDHQTIRWRAVSLNFDEAKDCVRLFEDGRLRAQYLESGSKFSLFGSDGSLIRTLDAPQEWQDPEF